MSNATRPLSPAAAAAQARRSSLATILAHKARCQVLPPLHDADVAAMLAAFVERGGKVTQCPTACVLPVQNGTGLALA
ncbi:hypothetical protein E2C06_35495 [Dankookia rubra]|uniref:Uncharacterized protein n=1 Tax=Dankookia rubra TaxID=1442381 RepID=A0A4R5Q4K7_9PROT|nr:hypothetical protein [Dankookia rubra]TDH57892.1 hypothetical protein E2C06_35495 [Dankookia rubra]